MTQTKDTSTALPLPSKLNEHNFIDGELFFAGYSETPRTPHPMPVVAVVEHDDDFMAMWLARRAAVCGVTADHLPAECQAAHQQALAERTDEVHQFAAMLDEMAQMDADLAALRVQVVEPLVTCQTMEEMYADYIEGDPIGE